MSLTYDTSDGSAYGQAIYPRPTIVPLPVQTADVTNPVIELNGTWQFAMDPLASEWTDSFASLVYSDIQVPGECMMQGYEIKQNQMYVYRTSVSIPPDFIGKTILLRFDGVFSQADVWLNGRKAGEHIGGFTSWNIDITNLVTPGGLSDLVIAITDRIDDLSRQTFYAQHPVGGIIRDVKMIAVTPSHITRFHYQSTFDHTYTDAVLRVDLAAAITADEIMEVRMLLHDPQDMDVLIEPESILLNSERHECSLDIALTSPQKWDAEHPCLYTLEASVMINGKFAQKLTQKVGLRQVEIKGRELLINGRAVKLKGVNRHDIHPIRGRSTTRELDDLDARLFKEANINFIRTSHYPPSESFLQACDRYGLYVEDETAVCWINVDMIAKAMAIEELDRKMGENEYANIYLQQFAEMIERDRSHPSVIIWSLGNENAWNANFSLECVYARQVDPGRPVIFSFPEYQTANHPKAPHDMYDLYSCHYREWYNPMAWDTVDKPILHDEAIAVSTHNKRTLARDPGVREYWGRSMRLFWDRMFTTEGCLGQAIWGAIDEIFWFPESIKNQHLLTGRGEWGIIDGWRRKKPEYWLAKKAFTPVLIDDQPLTHPGINQPLIIQITNRHDHTNLKEITIKWQAGHDKGILVSPDLAPHQEGLLFVPARDWKYGDLVNLIFVHDQQVIDEYMLPIGKPQTLFPAASGIAPMVEADQRSIIVSSGSLFSIEFNKQTGQIISGYLKGKLILTGGPVLNLTPYPLLPWQCTNIEYTRQKHQVIIKIAGHYGDVGVKFHLSFDHQGLIQTNYAIEQPPASLCEDFMDQTIDGYSEVGVAFLLAPSVDRLSWHRNALWSVYPDNHIGRPTGTADKFRKNLEIDPLDTQSGRIQPTWAWSQDTHGPYSSSSANGCVSATNDFRSTKEHIWYASAYLADTDCQLRIESDGKDAVRAEVIPDTSMIRLNVNSLWSYPSLSVNNYIPIQAIESGYTAAFNMRLTDRHDPITFYSDPERHVVYHYDPRICYKTVSCFIAGPVKMDTQGSVIVNRCKPQPYSGIVKGFRQRGEYAELAFIGSSIQWYGPKDARSGEAIVYLDNQPIAEVDCYSDSGWRDHQVLFSCDDLVHGRHIIRVEAKGSNASAATEAFVMIDCFEYW